MKTTTPQKLAESYASLHPKENLPLNEDTYQTFANWLAAYHTKPENKISMSNWSGKVTAALFNALGMKLPRTKKQALSNLQGNH